MATLREHETKNLAELTARQREDLAQERNTLKDQKEQIAAKETRLLHEREKIRGERDSMLSKQAQALNDALSSSNRNLAIVSAIAFIAGLALAKWILGA